MLNRPSARRKSEQAQVNINLVPMLDALVTLVAFLLFSSAFLAIVVIDTPAPLLAPVEEQTEKLKEQPLQLTAYVQADRIILSDWSGSRENHSIMSVNDDRTGEKRYDLEKLHQVLIGVKNRHPKETKIILKPEGGVSYEALIGIMDATRYFEKTDPPMYNKDDKGADQVEKKLFPEVIFGNLMS